MPKRNRAMYNNLEPVTDELTAHVRAITDAAGSVVLLTKHVDVVPETIRRLLRGEKKYVLTSTLEQLYDVRPEQFAWTPDPTIVGTLERARHGGLVIVDLIPFRQKDKYAAHLHTCRGWTKTEIADVLRMSGGRVTDAVGKCS